MRLRAALERQYVRQVLRLSGVPTRKSKARILVDYGRRHELRTLVETGTYRGNTTADCLPHFTHVYSIELDETLHRAAVARFAADTNITLIHGDSCAELGKLAQRVPEPALFWLDAHYCEGDSARGPHDPPLAWELRAILARGERDVVLVDDARLMGVNAGYPSIDEIRELVGARASSFEVQRDIIRIVLG